MNTIRTLICAAGLWLAATGAASALPSISVDPGTSPAGGYLPLSAFGITPTAMGDDDIVNLNVPSFVYAGQSWDRIGIVSNGYVVVGGGTVVDVLVFNTALPDPTAPNNILAPFWTDLDPSSGGAVRAGVLTDGLDSWLVIDWAEVPNWGDEELNSFEIWIGINGTEDISFTYGTVSDGDFGFLTVGANDVSGLIGDTYYLDGTGTLPTSGTSLRVTTVDLPVEVAEPATIGLLGAGLVALTRLRRRRATA